MPGEWLAIIMFGAFMVLITVGYPVAMSFALIGSMSMLLGMALGHFQVQQLNTLPTRFMDAETYKLLVAVPFFVYMGSIFEKSGQAERMLTAIGRLLGPVRGGLAITVVLVGTMLAAATGVVAATIIMMGLISLPAMVKYGYNHRLATGVIVGSGTLAQLLPPSLVLIVLASTTKVEIGALFRGAIVPGLMLAGLYCLYVVYVAIRYPEKAPALPIEERQKLRGAALWKESLMAIVPPMLLIFCVLGAIFQGVATPSEVGSVGAVAACILAAANRRLTWRVIGDAARSTANIVGLVMTMFLAANFFSFVWERLGGQRMVTDWLTGLPGGTWTFIVIANVAVFLLGVNLEFLEISFIVMPIFAPIAMEMGIDMVWFLVMMAVNLNIAFVSPPVGFSLFYLQSVKPDNVKTIDIHAGAIPFMVLQLVALVMVIAMPWTVTWLAGT